MRLKLLPFKLSNLNESLVTLMPCDSSRDFLDTNKQSKKGNVIILCYVQQIPESSLLPNLLE